MSLALTDHAPHQGAAAIKKLTPDNAVGIIQQMRMKKLVVLFIFVLGITFIQSCDDIKTSKASTDAFESLYPGTKVKSWTTKEDYEIAIFKKQHHTAEAWFDKNGWVQTVTHLSLEALPDPVSDSFRHTTFADSAWEVTGVNRLERKNRETIDVITVERNKVTYALAYNADGLLVIKKDITDVINDTTKLLPQPVPEKIQSLMKSRYPSAHFYEIEFEPTFIKLYIAEQQVPKQVIFSNSEEWLYTTWEVEKDSLPEKVKKVLYQKPYKGWTVEEIKSIESEREQFYTIELRKGEEFQAVSIDTNGKILKK